ncbi:PREDICTED: calcium-binding protein CAST-like [Lupinus angustifolius]|uniref:calcium-binding protein CAST-like n=1 Tax=Lupinus angustifolius TaxID=3871 RepID=UPI00092E33B5|nr:PREDICTED: calcium-binding protein CAST-like [Lupinus angustifolius]
MSDKIHNTCPLMQSSSPSSSFRLQSIFNMFDKNGDAIITVQEISQALNLLGLDAELKDIDSLIKSYIKTDNEGLMYKDFMEFAWDTLLFDSEQQESELCEAFKVFDEDGDGYISAQELQVVLRKLELIEGNEIDSVQNMIYCVDQNHDGRVDFFEFKDMFRTTFVTTS